jgi:hypothetical protein
MGCIDGINPVLMSKLSLTIYRFAQVNGHARLRVTHHGLTTLTVSRQ